MTKKRFMVLFLCFFVFLLFPPTTNHQPPTTLAQTKGIEVTQTYKISDVDVIEGDIVSNTTDGIIRSKKAYDSQILGVVQDKPLVVFRATDTTERPVVYRGTAYVNVTNINGQITRGDFITTSEIPGKGQKATKIGYILGTALDTPVATLSSELNFNGRNVSLSQIPVALRMENTNPLSLPTNIFDQILMGLLRNVADQDQLSDFFKYFVALLIFLSSLIFSFLTFSKVITKGVEGLGRNPLAKTSIQLSIILNIILLLVTTALGLLAAILIIRL